MMQILIYLLIMILSSLLMSKKEGLKGPMVGSVNFPKSYKGLVKTEITEKRDQRVSKNERGEHWLEAREDVDVKKDVDVVHRYPEVWNEASLRDCNEKKNIIHKDFYRLQNLKNTVRNLVAYRKQILGAIKNLNYNVDISKKKIDQRAINSVDNPLASIDPKQLMSVGNLY